MISTQQPEDFSARFEVVSCFIEQPGGKILILLRLPHKSEGGKWGPPAGKVEPDESLESAIIREAQEETGISLQDPVLFETYCVRYLEYDFLYHVFHTTTPADTLVRISPTEHQDFRWVTPKEALELELVTHQDDCTRFFYFP